MGQMIWLIGWKKPKAVKDVKDSKLSQSETNLNGEEMLFLRPKPKLSF